MMVRTLSAVACAALFAGPSVAETRYVSATGTDSGTCLVTAPCQTVDFAVRMAAAENDTVVCLTPTTADNLLIEKSITLDCSGNRAQFRDRFYFEPAKVSIVIRVGAGGTVRLRGFSTNGNPVASSSSRADRGIDIQSAAAVFLEDCFISNVNQQGIFDKRSSGQTRLYVSDCSINGANAGVVVASTSPASTVLDNVKLFNNGYGLAAATGNNVVIARSTISGNTTAGIHADGGAQINVVNSVLSHNTVNLNAYGTIRLQENAIQFSNVAVQGSAAVSGGGNRFFGNVAIGSTPSLASGAPADVLN